MTYIEIFKVGGKKKTHTLGIHMLLRRSWIEIQRLGAEDDEAETP